MRIHILGASGSGTSTLGRALASAHHFPFFDSDDFYWEPTDPPYRTPRPHDERRVVLLETVQDLPSWVVSGSMMGWGDAAIPMLDLVVYLSIPPGIRLERLHAREQARFGARLEPGGDMHAEHLAFMAWARDYDEGDLDIRSRASHARWLELPDCPVLRIEGDLPTEERVRSVSAEMARLSQRPRRSSESLAALRNARDRWPSE